MYKFSGPDSKFQNRISDPKGLENKIYTIMKGRETFDGDHTVPSTSCIEVQYVLQRGYTLEARITPKSPARDISFPILTD